MISHISLLLHNIRSTHNVGAIFRTADAVGTAKIYLSGHTPAPIDRFGRIRKDISKASLGAEKTVAWESVDNTIALIKKLKRQKIKIIAIEQDDKAMDYRKIKENLLIKSKNRIGKKALIIFGNEVNGIEKEILNICDIIAEIPMFGKKESLNVSVCAGIILYSLFK